MQNLAKASPRSSSKAAWMGLAGGCLIWNHGKLSTICMRLRLRGVTTHQCNQHGSSSFTHATLGNFRVALPRPSPAPTAAECPLHTRAQKRAQQHRANSAATSGRQRPREWDILRWGSHLKKRFQIRINLNVININMVRKSTYVLKKIVIKILNKK